MKIFQTNYITIIALFFFYGCRGQTAINSACNFSYLNAKNMIDFYAKTSDKSFLEKALNSLDTSIKCDLNKDKSIKLKILVYQMSSKYEKGFEFVDSLRIDDFDKPFKKMMYSNIFKASSLKDAYDTLGYKAKYIIITKEINHYLNNSKTELFDKETYSLLFYAESQYLTESELSAQIDALRKKYPTDADFINMFFVQYISSKNESVPD